MKLSVPIASHYGALITNDSFEVLMRKDASSSKGAFLRWEIKTDCEIVKFVCSRLIEECGIAAQFIVINPYLVFFKGGTLVNFLFMYSGGDVDALNFKWVSVSEAWKELSKLDDDEARSGELGSLSLLNNWIHDQRRKVAERKINRNQKEFYDKLDQLCHDARILLDRYPRYFDGIGMHSEFMQSTISSSAAEMEGIENFSSYLDSLCASVEKNGRSASREKDLINIVRFSLATAYRCLREGRFDDFLECCLRAEKFMALLGEIYKVEFSQEVRSRAIKGGGARRKGHVKTGEIEVVNSIILKALEDKSLYSKSDKPLDIASKIASVVHSGISESDL
ncbi:TPA: hypothetical protein ACGBES_001265, partial [Pseudomonas aeruginosa]